MKLGLLVPLVLALIVSHTATSAPLVDERRPERSAGFRGLALPPIHTGTDRRNGGLDRLPHGVFGNNGMGK